MKTEVRSPIDDFLYDYEARVHRFVVDNQAQASTAPTAQVNIATTNDLMMYVVLLRSP